ncbi:glycoside hydrolase family 88 protein [Saccharicrinis sp. 156]|uniref:glycoside hydrolase family 88 protein n=1 Tax=Saccharicrinis sp. 156 TaxID=3417574 RepID=UPI003D336C57
MKIKLASLFLFIVVMLIGCNNPASNGVQNIVDNVEAQFDYALGEIEKVKTDSLLWPRSVEKGAITMVPSKDWTSGFFPGNLWMLYELTQNDKWKELAMDYTLPLEPEKWNDDNHDIGFKMYCSFGHAIKYSDDPKLKEILIQSAKTLSTRYNPVVGCIRSWNSLTEQWAYPVIIDNMMNLELLMWAAKETGNEGFREIAIKHAQTTMKNHFRDDYSCYHVVGYNPETGAAEKKNTHQGYADDSDWTRGQGWALYGYTMMYRETGMEEFLNQAIHVAQYLINEADIKNGDVPYWDFDAPNIPNEPKDASAAAVISSALFELYQYSKDQEHYDVAKKLLDTMSSDDFFAKTGENGGFLLKHSTGSKPYNSEIDVPLVYADYYFLESLIKYKAMHKI